MATSSLLCVNKYCTKNAMPRTGFCKKCNNIVKDISHQCTMQEKIQQLEMATIDPTSELAPRLVTQRKCSVCRQPGHTKRTCPRNSTLVADRQRAAVATATATASTAVTGAADDRTAPAERERRARAAEARITAIGSAGGSQPVTSTLPHKVVEATDCPICLEQLGAISTVTTPCGHQFCWNCFGTHTQTKTNCPICRTEIPGVKPPPRPTPPPSSAPPTAGGSFPIFVQNLSTEAFNIFWLPPPDLSGAMRHPIQLHSNIRPGTTRRVNVGRRGDRFRLVHTGIRLAEFQTSTRSSDNFVYTGTEVIELAR